VNGRPAHRPSRRAAVIDAALGLFATYPPDSITVADIAAAADMTAAAVYYHFPSKEQVLLESVRSFTRRYTTELRRALAQHDGDWPGGVITDVLAWLEENRTPATVFFARSAGLDVTIEAHRREIRIEQVTLITRAIRARSAQRFSAAEAGVAAIAMLSLIETAAVSWLTQDAVFLGLGRQRFVDETIALAERIANAH